MIYCNYIDNELEYIRKIVLSEMLIDRIFSCIKKIKLLAFVSEQNVESEDLIIVMAVYMLGFGSYKVFK